MSMCTEICRWTPASRRIFLFGVASSLFLMVATLVPRANEASNEGLVFVNLERVIEQYEGTRKSHEELTGAVGGQIKGLDERAAKLSKQEEELQFLNPLGDEYRSRRIDLVLEIERVRLERESLREVYQRALVTSYRGIFSDISAEIEALSKERGYDAVFQVSDPLPGDQERTVDEVFLKLRFGQVLYHKSGLDVTDDLIARLNE